MSRTDGIEAEITELEKTPTQAEADGIETKLQIEGFEAQRAEKAKLEKRFAVKIQKKKGQVKTLEDALEISYEDGR